MPAEESESVCPGCGKSIPESSKKCYDCAKDGVEVEEESKTDSSSNTTEKAKHSIAVRILDSLSLTGLLLALSTSMASEDDDAPGAIGAVMLLLFVPMVRDWIEKKLGIRLSGVQFWIVTLALGFVGYYALTLV